MPVESPIPQEHRLYQQYELEEELNRIRYHYEPDAQFFYLITGGKWHVYSCIVWPNAESTAQEAEETKLDMMAKEMELQPGMRILDVGCGWGGPLLYMCQKYGVKGVGITINENQHKTAVARAAEMDIDATFILSPWQTFVDPEPYDAIYTDEVIVHFSRLDEFFVRAWNLLKVGGRFVNKELHLTHSRHTIMDRATEHINAVYGFTGNYRVMSEELRFLDQANFEVKSIQTIPISQYYHTSESWLNNMFENRDELRKLVGDERYWDFRKYLKLVRRVFTSGGFTMDIVASRKFDPTVLPLMNYK